MFLITHAFSFFTVNGIYSTEMNRNELFKAWIGNNGFIAKYSPSSLFELQPYSEEEFKNAVINDACRFSSSSLETVIGISKSEVISKSTAWIIVQLYYAAFYAAHSILRVSGNSFCQIEKDYSKTIEDNYRMYNIDPINIEEGMYHFYWNEVSKTIFSAKYKDSHTDLWNVFNGFLVKIQVDIRDRVKYPIEDEDLIVINSFIDSIRYCLNYDGCITKHNWLSVVRNNVNYQHRYGVWYPQSSKFNNDTIVSLIEKWKNDPISTISIQQKSDLDLFASCCISICSLAYDLTKDIGSKVSPKCLINKVFQRLYNIAINA